MKKYIRWNVLFAATAVESALFAVANNFGQQAIFYTVCACSLLSLIGSVFCLFCNLNKKEENEIKTSNVYEDIDTEIQRKKGAIKQNNSAPKLKPCPFCGGTAELKLSRRKGLFAKLKRFSHYQYVECTECHVRTKPYITTEDALMDWNTRANEKGCVEE